MERVNESLADVVFISIFGRGNWLASELAGRGWKVSLVDLSQHFENQPEDIEGPYGIFASADLQPSQMKRLTELTATTTAPSGFSLWLPEGPMECKSELTAFHLEKREISGRVQSYLQRPGLPGKEAQRERRLLAASPFEMSWLAHLAHQLASPIFSENHQSLNEGTALPIFAPFSLRYPTSESLSNELEACVRAGVKVRARASVKDIRMNGRQVDAMEIKDDRSGVESGKVFVWMLSSQETRALNESGLELLFPKGAIEGEWFWTRFGVELSANIYEDQIPTHVVHVGDLQLPWTHSNLLVIRKRPQARRLDVWMRVPHWASGDRTYFDRLRTEMEEVLRKRIPDSDPKTVAMPQEADTTKCLSRYQVFRPSVLHGLSSLNAGNLFFDGPEHWTSLDWTGQFRHQNKILENLTELKAKWDAVALRRTQSSQTQTNGVRHHD